MKIRFVATTYSSDVRGWIQYMPLVTTSTNVNDVTITATHPDHHLLYDALATLKEAWTRGQDLTDEYLCALIDDVVGLAP